jgi:hypothetical protein
VNDQKLPDGAVNWSRAADAEAFVAAVTERAGISSGTGYWDEEAGSIMEAIVSHLIAFKHGSLTIYEHPQHVLVVAHSFDNHLSSEPRIVRASGSGKHALLSALCTIFAARDQLGAPAAGQEQPAAELPF